MLTMFNWWTDKLFPSAWALYFFISNECVSIFLTYFSILVIVCHFGFSQPSFCELVPYGSFNMHFPNDIEGFPDDLAGKESVCNAGEAADVDLIPGSGRSLGGRNGNQLQDSCLKNPMVRGACQATVQRFLKSQTLLSMHIGLMFLSIILYAYCIHLTWRNIYPNPLLLLCVFIIDFMCSLYILNIRYMVLKYFIPFCGLSFYFLDTVFWLICVFVSF